jgi:hypothetical protein
MSNYNMMDPTMAMMGGGIPGAMPGMGMGLGMGMPGVMGPGLTPFAGTPSLTSSSTSTINPMTGSSSSTNSIDGSPQYKDNFNGKTLPTLTPPMNPDKQKNLSYFLLGGVGLAATISVAALLKGRGSKKALESLNTPVRSADPDLLHDVASAQLIETKKKLAAVEHGSTRKIEALTATNLEKDGKLESSEFKQATLASEKTAAHESLIRQQEHNRELGQVMTRNYVNARGSNWHELNDMATTIHNSAQAKSLDDLKSHFAPEMQEIPGFDSLLGSVLVKQKDTALLRELGKSKEALPNTATTLSNIPHGEDQHFMDSLDALTHEAQLAKANSNQHLFGDEQKKAIHDPLNELLSKANEYHQPERAQYIQQRIHDLGLNP